MRNIKRTISGLFVLLMSPVNAQADDPDWGALFGEEETISVADEPVADQPVTDEISRIVLPPQNAGEWLSQTPFPAELSICEQASGNQLTSDFDLTFTVDAQGNGGIATVSPSSAAPPAFVQCLSEIIQLADFEVVGEARHYSQHINVAPFEGDESDLAASSIAGPNGQDSSDPLNGHAWTPVSQPTMGYF
jgi:hypothetical protein